jgi:hypothetical protein
MITTANLLGTFHNLVVELGFFTIFAGMRVLKITVPGQRQSCIVIEFR